MWAAGPPKPIRLSHRNNRMISPNEDFAWGAGMTALTLEHPFAAAHGQAAVEKNCDAAHEHAKVSARLM